MCSSDLNAMRGVARDAGAAENEIDTIGRDALKLWGAWDGLSPVTTQMMAQTKLPVGTAAAGRKGQGLRGRISDRMERNQRDVVRDEGSHQSLHMNGLLRVMEISTQH